MTTQLEHLQAWIDEGGETGSLAEFWGEGNAEEIMHRFMNIALVYPTSPPWHIAAMSFVMGYHFREWLAQQERISL